MTRIMAIRHGETDWNTQGRIQGSLNIPLNAKGRLQAQQLARVLADIQIAAIYTSDLSRAQETADYIGQATRLVVQPEVGLRERGFGVFEGHSFLEIEQTQPELARRWRKREPDFQPEGGESLLQFRSRILATVNRLAAQHVGRQIVLVAHGGVMDVLYRAATGQELQAPRTWELGNAAINRLLWTPETFSLVGWADSSHLGEMALDELNT